MQRFLSPAVLDRTHDFDNHCDALNAIVERCYGRVAASLGISDQVEHARRRLATEISSGLISATGMPEKESCAFLKRWVEASALRRVQPSSQDGSGCRRVTFVGVRAVFGELSDLIADCSIVDYSFTGGYWRFLVFYAFSFLK